MATTTPNYNLRKPAPADTVNVELDIGANMDTIDAALATKSDTTHDHDADYEPAGAVATHAATSHGAVHPDLAAHDALGLATDAEITAALNAHLLDDNPHAQYDLDENTNAHFAATTAVHGIADTAALLTETTHDSLDHTGLPGVGGGGSTTVVGAHARRTTSQTIAAASTYTAISHESEVYDYGGLWVIGAPTRLTIPAGQGGLWMIGHRADAGQGFSSGKIIHAVIRKNGTDVPGTFISANSASNLWPNVAVSIPVVLAAADYLETFVWQDQGTNVPMQGQLWAYRIGSTS